MAQRPVTPPYAVPASGPALGSLGHSRLFGGRVYYQTAEYTVGTGGVMASMIKSLDAAASRGVTRVRAANQSTALGEIRDERDALGWFEFGQARHRQAHGGDGLRRDPAHGGLGGWRI